MNEQLQWNIMAERNRNDPNIPVLSKPGQIQRIEKGNNQYSCYLDLDCHSVYVIFDNGSEFSLPFFALQKTEQRGKQDDGILSEFLLILPTKEVVILALKHFANLNKNYVVLIQDEKYDYRNNLTNTFYTPSENLQPKSSSLRAGSSSQFHIADVSRVQIYFCFNPKRFFPLWNDITTNYNPIQLRIFGNSVSFIDKGNYIDSYVFNVQKNLNVSPDIKQHRFTALSEEIFQQLLNPESAFDISEKRKSPPKRLNFHQKGKRIDPRLMEMIENEDFISTEPLVPPIEVPTPIEIPLSKQPPLSIELLSPPQ